MRTEGVARPVSEGIWCVWASPEISEVACCGRRPIAAQLDDLVGSLGEIGGQIDAHLGQLLQVLAQLGLAGLAVALRLLIVERSLFAGELSAFPFGRRSETTTRSVAAGGAHDLAYLRRPRYVDLAYFRAGTARTDF